MFCRAGQDSNSEAYDLVIRVSPQSDATLVGRAFLHDRLVIVASPDLPLPPDEVPVPAVVRGPVGPPEHWTATTPSGARRIAVVPVLGLSSLLMVRDSVRLGVGVAPLPLFLAGPDLEAGTLVCRGDAEGPETALLALYPSRRLLSARVSAFLDHLKEALQQGTPEELAAYVMR